MIVRLGKNYVVVFDFLGKDSIRYYNELPVEKRVFKNLQLFMERKRGGDDLFDRLNVSHYFNYRSSISLLCIIYCTKRYFEIKSEVESLSFSKMYNSLKLSKN